ncbi:cell division ATP-binding protein FtsE [Pasteurella atlantica]|uniref:Cell division ATP-binding protein FtsE n=2 Tax=Pasteurellaceae TaxID=712 RepID=A0ACC6HL11_9PAST|nr:cell division ATP-binding protein FtsE [Pasteurella atlantica]MDP8033020.1 cell division ATP-binding protein FtsE [Pasteurella atlantica]MDP8034823.1 cell division ATP-binding protein FtsE [Pasteurella atlantica]MDP8036907.1 cell division ATP-binding protein FtsE [Pasteurella atlantica]MDP8047120.1 cell division ATP-binding protein FtsE [Pasteurella atlantica]MDP8049370.1 cell division ATP-binding protein FtsE [Pasteurella atlantica]
MIQFTNVNKAYIGARRPVLQDISFHLPAGEMAYLTGVSGAGKSTLLKLIMGMERVNGGKILFNGHDITRLPKRELPFLRRQIGMVHQNYALLTDRTILDNVALPLIIMGIKQSIVQREARIALERVGLENKTHYFPMQLSGGEQQRVDIARAIIHRPQLLLADEPTGNLDEKLSFDILRLFDAFNQSGTTVLIATHDTNIINQSSKVCLGLENGHLKRIS